MRDDRHRWTPQSAHFDPIMIGAVTLQEIKLNRQIMVSGPAVRDTFGPATGWPAVVSGDSYTLSLRRDRVLIVNGPAMAAGWDAAQDQARQRCDRWRAGV